MVIMTIERFIRGSSRDSIIVYLEVIYLFSFTTYKNRFQDQIKYI